jgi:hypothetical protein
LHIDSQMGLGTQVILTMPMYQRALATASAAAAHGLVQIAGRAA